jgi:hypothetical protein
VVCAYRASCLRTACLSRSLIIPIPLLLYVSLHGSASFEAALKNSRPEHDRNGKTLSVSAAKLASIAENATRGRDLVAAFVQKVRCLP